MSNDSPGDRIRYWRKRRGLTVSALADRAGIGKKTLEHLESGERELRLIDHLDRLSRALAIDPALLVDLGRPRAAPGPDATEIADLRAALQRPGAITGLYGGQATAVDGERLRKEATYLWTTFQSSGYSTIGGRLPRLLIDAQHAARTDADRQSAAVTLCLAYQLAASMLWKLQHPDLAWLAAERAFCLAEGVGDPLLMSDAARRVAHGLLATGHPEDALALIHADIERLDAGLPTADAEYLSVYGMLPLMGSVIAGRAGRQSAVRDLLQLGAKTAARLGADANHHWTAFGPTNVAIHRTAVMADLGDGQLAVDAAATIAPEALAGLPRERRASLLLDTARGYALAGRRREALERLEAADSLAPEEIRARPVARVLVDTLMRDWPGRAPVELRQLASRIGLPA